jgi:hypothetical protein
VMGVPKQECPGERPGVDGPSVVTTHINRDASHDHYATTIRAGTASGGIPIRAFVARFPTGMRSYITTAFLDTVRDGVTSLDIVIAATAMKRLHRAQHWREVDNVTKFAGLPYLLNSHSVAVLPLGPWWLAYEAIPWAERVHCKFEHDRAYLRR